MTQAEFDREYKWEEVHTKAGENGYSCDVSGFRLVDSTGKVVGITETLKLLNVSTNHQVGMCRQIKEL